MPSREGRLTAAPPAVSGSGRSLHLGDRPAKAGQLPGGRDGDQGAALAAPLHPLPDAVQAPLRRPGDRDRVRRLALLAPLELDTDPGLVAVVPGGLDQQPPGVARARAGDRAEPAGLARGVLGGHEAEIAHQLPCSRKALEVADLGTEPDRGEGVDAAEAAQPPHLTRPGRLGDRRVDLTLNLRPAM